MALFKFTKKILRNEEIEVFNHGKLDRDFTYIDDIVNGVFKLIFKFPDKNKKNQFDNLSNVAPYRIVNLGSSKPINLMTYIELIEDNLGIKAKKKFIQNQSGDVFSTWSDIKLANSLVQFSPQTKIEDGIKNFITWFKNYYKL